MKFKDYYQTLGVERSATQDDIKHAYRRLARKYHPDVSKEADAETRFKDIGEAYAVLKDPETVSYTHLLEELAADRGLSPLIPRSGPERRQVQQVMALAIIAAEKSVAMQYERNRPLELQSLSLIHI